jgi:hypothetical protein
MKSFPIPLCVQPEYLSKVLDYKALKKLNELADRGIYLNTWQVNQMFLGERALGKTFLAYVQIAEKYKKTGCILYAKDIEEWDNECTSFNTSINWLRDFYEFLNKYYSDIYKTIELKHDSIVLKTNEQNDRWWRINS